MSRVCHAQLPHTVRLAATFRRDRPHAPRDLESAPARSLAGSTGVRLLIAAYHRFFASKLRKEDEVFRFKRSRRRRGGSCPRFGVQAVVRRPVFPRNPSWHAWPARQRRPCYARMLRRGAPFFFSSIRKRTSSARNPGTSARTQYLPGASILRFSKVVRNPMPPPSASMRTASWV